MSIKIEATCKTCGSQCVPNKDNELLLDCPNADCPDNIVRKLKEYAINNPIDYLQKLNTGLLGKTDVKSIQELMRKYAYEMRIDDTPIRVQLTYDIILGKKEWHLSYSNRIYGVIPQLVHEKVKKYFFGEDEVKTMRSLLNPNETFHLKKEITGEN